MAIIPGEQSPGGFDSFGPSADKTVDAQRRDLITELVQTSKPRYLTDGRYLYEIVAQRLVENFGCAGPEGLRGDRRPGELCRSNDVIPTIGYTVLRDCVSEATATIDDLQLAALSEVR